MTLRELKQIVSLGEGISLEFKRKVPRDERIAKELIALANTHGGRILLGVDDDGTITGVDDAAEEEFVLRRAADTHCRPAVEFTTERVPVATRRDVLLVTVPESRTKPHHLVPGTASVSGDGPAPTDGTADGEGAMDGEGTAYVRVEEMSVEASPESVRIMRDQNEQEGVTFEFGENESLLMRYLDDYGRITVAEFAKLADISAEKASQTLVSLTKADLLRLHSDRQDDYFTLAY